MSQNREEHQSVPARDDIQDAQAAPGQTCAQPVIGELLSLMEEAVMILDHTGRICGWSQGAERLLGHRAADVLDKPASMLFPPSWCEAFESLRADLNKDKRRADLRVPMTGNDGLERLFEIGMRLIPHKGEGGQGIVCTLSSQSGQGSSRDLSARQIRGFWALLESIPVASLHIDTNRRILSLNGAARLHVPPGNHGILGRHMNEVFGEAIFGQLAPDIDQVLSGQECSAEVTLPHLDGTDHHFLQHLYPHVSADGSVQSCFLVLIDVTEAKVTQESLLRSEQSLRSTLVREINHRVKNSLQGLIGIMRLYDPVK